VAESCWFTPTHEWLRQEGDALRIGITVHAAEALGDLVYVELPEPGRQVVTGEGMAVVESVKAASDVYSPVCGEVLEVNAALADHPELVNEDPMGEGWLLRIYPLGPLENLLDQAGYDALVQAQGQP
jgi:glycine cleavage system H protein